MKKVTLWIKKISLFLLGITLVVWGYKVNAANNAKAKEADKDESETPTPPSSIFNPIELKDSTKTTQTPLKKSEVETKSDKKKQPEKKETKSSKEKNKKTETVIESDKKVEESSGTN